MRPSMLARALVAMESLTIPKGVFPLLLIVDNDPEGSARAIVDAARPFLPIPVQYVIEPRRGIPFARNRVLTEALELGADYVAFFDDDEIPAPAWIDTLYRGLKQHNADVIGGPVRRTLNQGANRWVDAADRIRLSKDDRKLLYNCVGSTNNCLFSMRLVRDLGLFFDEKFEHCGGSDSDFFTRSRLLGARHARVRDVLMTEQMPKSRQTLSWYMRRYYRQSVSTAYSYRLRRGLGPAVLKYAPRSVGNIAAGLYYLAAAPWQREQAIMRAIKRFVSSGANLAGVFGMTYSEYTRHHGR
ncbi:MAG: glycosyltransferase [Pseudomonadota bacterium]